MNFALWLFEAEYTDVRNTYSDLMDYLEKTPEDVYVHFGDNPNINYKIQRLGGLF